MKHNVFLWFFLLLGTLSLSAQTHFVVSGVLVDSLTTLPEPYATIRISKQEKPEHPVKMGITDEKGRFRLPLTDKGEYVIVISSVGKRTVRKVFSTGEKQQVELGTLFTRESSEELKGVEVVARKPLVRAEPDKLVYSMEDDPDANTSNALEMLRKVPLVTVDGNEKISVRGTDRFQIHLNGRYSPMLSNNAAEMLRNMPASTIRKIEVISNPGAKYDAEGTPAILNIITTERKKENGYSSTFTLSGGNLSWGVGNNTNVQFGKWTIGGFVNYSMNGSTATEGEAYRENKVSEDYRYVETDSRIMPGKMPYGVGSLDASYEIDTLNLMTFSFGLRHMGMESEERSNNRFYDENRNRLGGYSSDLFNRMSRPSYSAGVNYQHNLRKKERFFTLGYLWSYTPQRTEYKQRYEEMTFPKDTFSPEMQQIMKAINREYTFQADLVYPINPTHGLELGAKYILRHNHSDNTRRTVGEDGRLTDVSLPEALFDNGQDIVAGYVNYLLKQKRFNAKAGLRYEHTRMSIAYPNQSERDFSKYMGDWMPAVSFSYQLSDTRSLQLNYKVNIWRPSISMLNPYRMIVSPIQTRIGNPELNTERVHRIGLSYNLFTPKFSTNIDLSHNFSDNSIYPYYTVDGNITTMTYGNVGRLSETNLSAWINWNIGKNTRINLNNSLRYTRLSSDVVRAKSEGWYYFGNLNVQQSLPRKFTLGATGGFSTGMRTLQGKMNGYHYTSVNLNRTFLQEDRLRVGLSLNNFFPIRSRGEESTDEYHMRWEWIQHPFNVSLNLNWRFGNLNKQVKQTGRNIRNDDIKQQ